jgi:hypothetical protein
MALKVKDADGNNVYFDKAGAGTVSDPYTDGTPITGQGLEAGGAGVLGWLASIRKKIAAFGTAGTPSADVLTVQGVASGTTLEVGGNSAVVTLSFTVSTTPAYTSGDVIGGKVTIANALRTAGKNALLQDLFLFDNANQKPAGSLLFFNADPSAATTTDNSAFAYSTDTTKQCGRVDITASDWMTINGKASLHLKNIGAMLSASGTTLYAVFVTTSTPTYTATTDLSGAIGLLRD